MDLLYKDAYPILLGQPWLRTAQWSTISQKPCSHFGEEEKMFYLHTTKGPAPDKSLALLYTESVNMLEGLMEEEAENFL
jgi:hypothetical protein